MKRQFNEILDECIEKIISQKATVAECLASHPDCAAQLERSLRLAERLTDAVEIRPSAAAKAAGRQRLQAEIAAPPHPTPSPAPKSPQASAARPARRKVHLHGALEKGDRTAWAVQSRPIQISASTAIAGNLREGSRVDIVGFLLGDGVLAASIVEVLGDSSAP